MRVMTVAAVLAALAAGCGDGGGTPSTPRPASSAGCADVVDVEVEASEDGAFRFDVTVRSADTGWEKYADAWEVRDGDGTTLATRELLHPHVDEQPFTRSLGGVVIPASVTRVEVVARDSVAGFCGETVSVDLPGR